MPQEKLWGLEMETAGRNGEPAAIKMQELEKV